MTRAFPSLAALLVMTGCAMFKEPPPEVESAPEEEPRATEPPPAVAKVTPKPSPAPPAPAVQPPLAGSAPTPAAKPAPAPAQGAERFDFYTMLPGLNDASGAAAP